MVCDTFSQHDSTIHRLDPRARIIVAFAFAVLLAISTSILVPSIGVAVALGAMAAARLPLAATAKRLAGVNCFLLILLVFLPLIASGPCLFRIGPVGYSREGFLQAARISLRCNAILLTFTALLSTMETSTLGHALSHLRLPQKLVHLFLFTVRYIDVLHHESARLRRAMKVRCFRPGANARTFRTIGYLAGMLLVRAHDRSMRIMDAMKCRGFRGRFHVLTHFTATQQDVVFVLASLTVILVLAWMEIR
ncbi:MAG: cobalt ECF transporter T component CbiQ [Planctomycetes bacterium]|nr:cobalt ECF transporter T component CbiQ [Planctomycetota bacterium]